MATPASPSQRPVAPPAKMATRSSDAKRQPSIVSEEQLHQHEQREDSRDCQDHEAAREAAEEHDGGRDPSPPSGFHFDEREKAAAAKAAGDAAGTPRSHASHRSSGHLRHSSHGPGEALAAALPLGADLANPSWEQDLLNQDSFGFNLLDNQGNLSFDCEDAAKGGTPRGATKDRSGEDGGRQAMDWTAGHGDVVVNSATHNWIPPGAADGHYGSYHYGGPHAEMREPYDDPFKYAFGDPAPSAAGGSSAKPAKGRSGKSSKKRASRRSKKRKQLDRAEPLDGHHSPPPLATVESAPTATMDFHPPHGPPVISGSSTWGAYGYGPPMTGPDVHNAFLPPMPAQPNGAPMSEVYVKGHPYGMPPPYAYPPAPDASTSGAPPLPRTTAKGSSKSRRSNNRPSASGSTAVVPVRQPNQPTPKGVALLRLPNGAHLTRDQAPGIGWPPEEDVRLTEAMSRNKSSQADWDRLAKDHGHGRTARECHDRWTRYLKPGSRKGQWKEEEDAVVLRAIFASGAARAAADQGGAAARDAIPLEPHPPFTQWADLAPQLPGRTGKQIRDRWVNYLNPAINHLPFSREDDLRLWQGHKDLGKRWVEISVKVFHSTRSENHIKNRWYSAAFKKFIAKEFGMDAYLDAKEAQGGVIGSVTMGRSAANGGRGHPAARQVHGGNVRNGRIMGMPTRSQGV